MKQSISSFEIVAIVACFSGIVMISLGSPGDDSADNKRIAQLTGPFFEFLGIKGCYILGTFLAVVFALMSSIVSLLTRELKNVHFSIIMFNYALFLIVSSATIMTISFFI
jgi:hypothetical protein